MEFAKGPDAVLKGGLPTLRPSAVHQSNSARGAGSTAGRRLRLLGSVLRPLAALGIVSLALTLTASVPEAQANLAQIAGQTLDLKADELDVDISKGRATLKGNVHATLGELTVVCPKVEMSYDEAPQVRWARGTGGVEARVQGIVARAAVVEVDVAKQKVDLSGGVRLTRGKGWVEAERASIDIATYRVSLHEVKGSIPVKPPAR